MDTFIFLILWVFCGILAVAGFIWFLRKEIPDGRWTVGGVTILSLMSLTGPLCLVAMLLLGAGVFIFTRDFWRKEIF